jgi:hypothetical protein
MPTPRRAAEEGARHAHALVADDNEFRAAFLLAPLNRSSDAQAQLGGSIN